MAALAAAAEAARFTVGRGALDRTGQGRVRRHQHGHRAAVAGLRRDGGLSGVHRGAAAAIPDRALGLPRLDPGAHRPVDARAHRGGDRRAGSAVQAAVGPIGKRRHDPRDGPPAAARRLRGQPGRVPPAAPAMADVCFRAGPDPHRARNRRQRHRIPMEAREVHICYRVSGTAAGRASGGRFHRVLGGSVGDALAGGLRCRSHQNRVDSAAGRNPLLGWHAQGCRRLVGVRLGLPRHEHQQAFGHARPADRCRHRLGQEA